MKIVITRDSVSAADDCDTPHETLIQVANNSNIKEILKTILGLKYLPLITGGKATWSASGSKPLAVIAQEWKEPKLICLEDYPFYDTKGLIQIQEIHFNYHAQCSPNIVFEVLKTYRHGK